MINISYASILLLALCPLSLRAAEAAHAVNAKNAGLTLRREFPETALRGYGKISGRLWTDAAGGSLLAITCQDEAHARLLQAKFLSDLDALPPATQPVKAGTLSAREVVGRGDVAALRNGATVAVVTAAGRDALAGLATAALGDPAAWRSEPEQKVPMYLDRWDKYGFRFYYGPGVLKPGPDGRHAQPDYDPSADFSFAEASNHSGLTVWQNGEKSTTAEWLTSDPSWEWALKEAQRRGLPFGINLGIDSRLYWLYNRAPETMMQFAPDFLGGYYGSLNFGMGSMVSWSSRQGQDILLAQLQQTVRRFHDVDNITSWLEPHEELGHGIADLFTDWGPQADADYREYLKGRYKTLQALSQRWLGDAGALRSWDDVKVPEPADFLGWGPDAVDLAGPWKVSLGDDAADNAAFLAPDFDDEAWPSIEAPGHGLARTLPQKPALWRRHFSVPAGWLEKHPKVWLYVWHLNETRGAAKDPSKRVTVTLNGKTLVDGDKPLVEMDEVASLLRPEGNVLAVRLPQGLFNYRIYLSGEAPKSYPELGAGKNAQWADFFDWTVAIRCRETRRGMQAIRQVDPDRGIVLMSPDSFWDGVQQAAIEYGGDFHNTGYMGGWWCDRLPALMRGAGLPMSTEPGNGPSKPEHLMGAFGNWCTEGVNAVDLFQNLGEVLWNPEVKKCFEDHVNLWTTIGRYHAPEGRIAALYSSRVSRLFGFPWDLNPAKQGDGQPYFRSCGYPSGFNARGFFSLMENIPPGGIAYDSDAVTETGMARGQAGRYKVIVDTGTVVLDDDVLDGIERYVRDGGIFVTYGDTGRHSSAEPDTWPISRLSGFRPAPDKGGFLHALPGQEILPDGWTSPEKAGGYQLVPTAEAFDTQTVAKWDDGKAAIGLRPLGKGYVVTLGPVFGSMTGADLFDRLFKWLEIEPIPARFEPASGDTKGVIWRRFVSNNGLSDVWVVFNRQKDQELQGTLVLGDGLRPAWKIDLRTGEKTPVTDGRIDIRLSGLETAVYVTPRAELAEAPSRWFDLQREWWKGVGDPGAPFPPATPKLLVDLTDGWRLHAADPALADVGAFTATQADDKDWPQARLGIVSLPDHPEMRRAILRRHIRIPAEWKGDRASLRLPSFFQNAKFYLDGAAVSADALPDLEPGTEHVLTVDVTSPGAYLGAKGPAWLLRHPAPAGRQDLSGPWQTSGDGLSWQEAAPLPGPMAQEARFFRRTVKIDPAAAGKTVVVHVEQSGRSIIGVIANGQYLCPAVPDAPEININVTPWVKPGEENELILVGRGWKSLASAVTLEFHAPGTYP